MFPNAILKIQHVRKYYEIWIAFETVNMLFCYEQPHEGYEWLCCIFMKGSSPKECLQKDPAIRRSSLIILWKAGSIFRFSGLVLVLLGSDQYSWQTGQIKLSTSWNCELHLLTSVKMYVHFVIKRENTDWKIGCFRFKLWSQGKTD